MEQQADSDSGGSVAWTPLRQNRQSLWRRSRGWVIGGTLLLMIAAVTYVVIECWPSAQSGHTVEIVQGSLQIQLGRGAPWIDATEGQVMSQGSRLRSASGTIASIQLLGSSLMRIESGGEWVISSLASSRNARIQRVVIDQQRGQASYVSLPSQRFFPPVFRIQVREAECDLLGTATLATDGDGLTHALVHEGLCRVTTELDRFELREGETLTIRPKGVPVTPR